MANELLIAIEELLDRKLDEKLEPVHERLDKLDAKVNRLDESVHRMEIMLENEMRPNITRVAESHLNLNKKLNEALTRSAEAEMMAVKVNYHDMQIRNLKEFGAVL